VTELFAAADLPS